MCVWIDLGAVRSPQASFIFDIATSATVQKDLRQWEKALHLLLVGMPSLGDLAVRLLSA